MKTIFRHLWRDKVSLIIWLITIAAAIAGIEAMLYILVLFIFRGMMWEGQYHDALKKYVTDPAFREQLGLDIKERKMSIIEIVYNTIFFMGVAFVVVYLIVNR